MEVQAIVHLSIWELSVLYWACQPGPSMYTVQCVVKEHECVVESIAKQSTKTNSNALVGPERSRMVVVIFDGGCLGN